MVRVIVGTLVEVGLGERDGSEIPGILAVRDRRVAGKTAPPQGLCLVEVEY
jgi:tRNA pseudouridine38-40 synthase